jgi:hypothetical protein
MKENYEIFKVGMANLNDKLDNLKDEVEAVKS